MAKFDPFLSLYCAGVEGGRAQSKEKKGSNFAVQRSGAIVLQAQRAKGVQPENWLCSSGNHAYLAAVALVLPRLPLLGTAQHGAVDPLADDLQRLGVAPAVGARVHRCRGAPWGHKQTHIDLGRTVARKTNVTVVKVHYRVTIQMVLNLPLTPKQMLRFRL